MRTPPPRHLDITPPKLQSSSIEKRDGMTTSKSYISQKRRRKQQQQQQQQQTTTKTGTRMTQLTKGDKNDAFIDQQHPSSGTGGNVMVEVVTTDEEAIAVPVAESIPVPMDPKDQQQQSHFHPTGTTYVMDSGFDCLLCGDVKVKRIRPGSNVFLSLCGDVYMDMREEDYPAGSTFSIFILRLCGNVRMIVPHGTQVRARRLLLCGDRDVHVRDSESYDSPHHSITINVLMLCGDFKVRSDYEDM